MPLHSVRITLNLQVIIDQQEILSNKNFCLPSLISHHREKEARVDRAFILHSLLCPSPPLPCARLNLSRNFFARALTLLVFARCPGSPIISPATHGRARLGLSLGKVTEYPCLTLLFCKLTYAPVMHNLSLDRLTQIFKCKCPFLRIPDASHLPH